jgi:hypothetical protein
MATIIDLLDGQFTETPSGGNGTRIARVDLAPGGTIADALGAPGLPALGALWPRRSDAKLIARTATADPNSNERAEVRLEYGQDIEGDAIGGEADVEVFTETVTLQSITDATGKLMSADYVGLGASRSGSATLKDPLDPSQGTVAPATQIHRIHQVFQADVDVAQLGLRVNRAVSRRSMALYRRFAGTVNGAPWSGEFAPRTCYCRGPDVGRRGNVITESWVFMLAPSLTGESATFDAEFKMSLNGVVPFDISQNNGIARFRVYRETDFNSLFRVTF